MLARVDGIRATKDEARAMEAFEDLVAMGEPAVAPLIRVYQDAKADPRTRWVAGRALGRLAYAASTDALIAGLRDPQPMARVAAARALQDQGQRRAVPALVKALDDPGAIVRAAVIDALGTLGSSREAKAVAAQLTDSKNFIRQQGLFVRTHAAAALGRLGGPDAIEALIEVVEDRDKETRAAAQASLFTLSGRSTTPSGAGGEKARWQAWWKESR
jgi:HEAT repeat protein